MKPVILFPYGTTPALAWAVEVLKSREIQIAPVPHGNVTHLLLPVPSFENGQVRGGGDLEALLSQLPSNVTVLGGNLTHPLLAGYRKIDLLHRESYVAENAEFTAQCTLRLLLNQLPVRLRGLPVLIIGWGRIGKCLGQKLRLLGADVTVAARKERDCAMLRALGYRPLPMEKLPDALWEFRVICNTAPALILPENAMKVCRRDCIKVDLASNCGMEGENVIWARGLPGKNLPESSGVLIAQTVLEILEEDGI